MQIKLEKSEIDLLKRINEPRIRKRKLRPLIQSPKHPRIDLSFTENEEKAEKTCESSDEVDTNSSKLKYILIVVLISAATAIVSQVEWSQCGLWATYNNNFNKIVHGDERYCHRELDPARIITELRYNVVNQNDAIKLIQASLQLANRENFVSMAFSGSVGVGKTLSSNLIAENFKWQGNVNQLIYDINFDMNIMTNESLEFDLDVATAEFSSCGFNLVIIDDVPVKQASIERITKLEQELHELAKRKVYKIVLIVIFRGEVSQKDLQHFVIVDFQAFTRESFNECIEKHLQQSNVILSPAEILSLQLVNFNTFGCKTVGKKITNLLAQV